MPTVGVVFELSHALTSPGDVVQVVGNTLEMGSWQPCAQRQEMQLRTSPLTYPRWIMAWPLWIQGSYTDAGLLLEYKYVQLQKTEACRWEDGKANRRVVLPCIPSGSIVVISDRAWGCTEVPAQVRNCSLHELIGARREVDPIWTPSSAPPPKAEAELEALRRENAGLREALLSAEQIAEPDAAAKDYSPAPLRSLAQLTMEGFHWEWPLSRCERKQRLLMAECQLQALDEQQVLHEFFEDYSEDLREMAYESEVLRGEIKKLRAGREAAEPAPSRPAALRGGA